jgi:hypothetical protein
MFLLKQPRLVIGVHGCGKSLISIESSPCRLDPVGQFEQRDVRRDRSGPLVYFRRKMGGLWNRTGHRRDLEPVLVVD